MVEKMGLKKKIHHIPYKVSYLQKGHQLLVNEQCEVEFHIGSYKDKVLCDIIPMDVCHILLGIPWQYDRKAIHDGRINTYTFEKDGENHTFLPLKDEGTTEKFIPKVLLISGKEFMQEIKNEEVHFGLDGKPKVILTITSLNDLLEEVKILLILWLMNFQVSCLP
jgi:hypothetical protein